MWKQTQALTALKRIAYLPEEVQVVVGRMQPVLWSEGDSTPAERKALSLLNQFSNQDKHHRATVSAVRANQWDHSFNLEFEEAPDSLPAIVFDGDLVDGGELLRVSTAPHRIKQVSGSWHMDGGVVVMLGSQEVTMITSLQGMIHDARMVVVGLTMSAAGRDWLHAATQYCPVHLVDLSPVANADERRCPECGIGGSTAMLDAERASAQ